MSRVGDCRAATISCVDDKRLADQIIAFLSRSGTGAG
jgi:hypothetical protein